MPEISGKFAIRQSIVKVLRNRFIEHLLFWALSFYVLLRLFAYEIPPELTDWIYTFLFHISLVFVVYINLIILIPRFLRSQQYFIYGISAFLLLIAGTYLNLFTFNVLADRLFPGYYFIAYYHFIDILQFVLVYFILSTLFKLSKGWFQLNVQEKQLAQLQREKTDAELKALKHQLDPHFLFNSLNSLYALALDGDERTPEGLMKLAENMRYTLYDCSDRFVPLERELDFIRNYVALQQMRLDEGVSVDLRITGEPEALKIAPLLLLPLIENAFKHGTKGRRQKSTIEIDIGIAGARLVCRVVNDLSTAKTELPENAGGIGLNNLQRRLDLLYPKKHDLVIEQEERQFIVQLNLDLHEN